jgi:hypothetical protein
MASTRSGLQGVPIYGTNEILRSSVSTCVAAQYVPPSGCQHSLSSPTGQRITGVPDSPDAR